MRKVQRGNASQFFVAGELCRRGYVAVVTMGNTPNTDILCSNVEGTKFLHIQVKTFKPKSRTCTVGKKSENDYGENFIWVLCGLPEVDDDTPPEFYIIPSSEMSKQISRSHQEWLNGRPAKGRTRKDSGMRTVIIPPYTSSSGWSIEGYKGNWNVIENLLSTN
jgi:hypothetical protein